MVFLDDYVDLSKPHNLNEIAVVNTFGPAYFCYVKEDNEFNYIFLHNLIGGTVYLLGSAFHVVNLKTYYHGDYVDNGMKYRLGLEKIYCETFEQIKEALINEIS